MFGESGLHRLFRVGYDVGVHVRTTDADCSASHGDIPALDNDTDPCSPHVHPSTSTDRDSDNCPGRTHQHAGSSDTHTDHDAAVSNTDIILRRTLRQSAAFANRVSRG